MEALIRSLVFPQRKWVGSWKSTEVFLSLLVIVHFFLVWFIAHHYNRPEAFQGLLYIPMAARIPFVLETYIFLRTIWIMLVWRPQALAQTILQDFREHFCHPRRLSQTFLLIPLFIGFFGAFSSMKVLIPIVNPYRWDHTFALLDEQLHGGIQPWQLLHPILGFPHVTTTLNFFYNLWFFLLLFVFFWQALTLHLPRVRLQFLLTFFLSWIVIGNLFAVLFSSAGPCYYEAVTGSAQGNPYAELMAYLRQANDYSPVWALSIQELLWQNYQAKTLIAGAGISAMPSMHVSMAFLFALLGWRWGRPYSTVLGLYCGLIVLGSIHLAWHYAIDAYVAILFTYGLWRFSGFIVEGSEPTLPHHTPSTKADTEPA